jgi:hypothetical protein
MIPHDEKVKKAMNATLSVANTLAAIRDSTFTDGKVYVAGEYVANYLAYPGAKLFQLKATHGLPLENAVDTIINRAKLVIDWEGFIDEARKNGWYDFQTIENIEQALVDADILKDTREKIIQGCKHYILANILP